MNTLIARIYQTQQRLTGLFVSAGSMLAITLELSLIVAGFVIKSEQSAPDNYALMVLFAIVGLLVALLITKLTLTNAAKLRLSLDAERALSDEYKENAKGKILPSDVKAVLDKDIKDVASGRRAICLLIAIGSLASIVCEMFVMQILFSSLKPEWLGTGLSFFLSALVSCTVVSGELHKKRDSELIKSSFSRDSFLELAAKANVYDAFNHKMISEASTYVEQVLDKDVLATYARTLVYKSIKESTGTQGFAAQVEAVRVQQLQLARVQEDTKQRILAEVRGENDVDTDPVQPIRLVANLGTFPDAEQASEECSDGMETGPETDIDTDASLEAQCITSGHGTDIDTDSNVRLPIKISSRRKSMSVTQAATFLGITDRQVRRLREQGILIADGHNQITSASVKAYNKKRSAKLGPEGA